MSITRLKANGDKFTLYAVCNSRGDVEELRKESGSLYARYVYDSWGNVLHIYSGTGTTKITDTDNLAVQNPIRYRGYYYDAESGLYYLQSRYYDPVTGRFVNADSLVDTSDVLGFNMYASVGLDLFTEAEIDKVIRVYRNMLDSKEFDEYKENINLIISALELIKADTSFIDIEIVEMMANNN